MKTAQLAVLGVVTVLLCGSAHAQPADWTGRYTELRGKSLGALKQVNPNLGDGITAHVQPWARATMEATDGVADDTGAICEYRVTTEDPKNLPKPAAYTRYYEKLKMEIQENVCEDQE